MVNKGRLVGVVIGLVMLAAIFLLPFSNIVDGPGGPSRTLFDILRFFISNLSVEGAAPTLLYTAFIYQIAAVLLIAAALVGLFPLGSGILGIVGMGFVTVGPFVVFNRYSFDAANFGAAFYILWVLSAVQIVVAFMVARGTRQKPRREEAPAVTVQEAKEEAMKKAAQPEPQADTPADSPMETGKVCPNCGTVNGENAAVCVKCAEPL